MNFGGLKIPGFMFDIVTWRFLVLIELTSGLPGRC